jgi:hypothetical protein
MIKTIITLVFVAAVLFSSAAQPKIEEWSRKFNAYQSIWRKTKIHLTLQQDKFSPGDTVWFKAYFLTEDLRVVEGKQLLDLNVVDSQGEVKIHFLFTVINGIGHNQFLLPEDLTPGMYTIAAHSSWMRNFDPELIFKKHIQVVRKNKLIEDHQPYISVSPEGGPLIGNVSNRLVIKNLPNTAVKIIDHTGHEIGKTVTDADGFGSMILRPGKGQFYFLRISDDSVKIPIPPVKDDGISLRLTPGLSTKPTKIILSSPSSSRFRNEQLTILINSRGRIIHTASFVQETQDSVSIEIPPGITKGVAHLSLLDRAGNLLASRDYYQPGVDNLQASIHTEKEQFQRREKVKVSISLTDKTGQPVEGDFSIRVRNTGLFDANNQNSFADELNITSAETLHIDRSDINSLTTLDNYLITTSSEVPWKAILSQDSPRPAFAFTSAVRKIGRALYANTLEPVPDGTQIMFYLQKDMMRYQTSTSENGKVMLTMPDVFAADEFFYLGETRRGKEVLNLKIEWAEEPFRLPPSDFSTESNTPDPYASFVSKTKLIDRSYGFYTSPEYLNAEGKRRTGDDFEYEFGGADVTVNLEEYLVYPTMEELIREVIPSLFHRVKSGEHFVHVNLSEAMMRMTTGGPLYIIDGIATKNTDFFLSLKPVDVLRVKIIKDPKKLMPLGLLGKNGIVLVETQSGDVREPLDDPAKLIEGISRPLKFSGPDYSTTNDPRIPDFRSTIHWNPSIKADKNGNAVVEFFCSDDLGKISIRIDGLTTNGEPFSAEDYIEVVNLAGK